MVILSHGFGGDMTFHLWEPITKILNGKGIGVLRYDFNGCGQSEGEFQNMTVLNEIEDLMCVISYVRSLPVTENISLVGHSYELPRGLKLGRDYIQTAMTLPIYETASKYKGKTLIINGMADQVVPFTYAQLYNKVISDSELILIPGEDHTYSIAPEYAVKIVSDCLIDKLIE